ncbi:Alpha/Beta hydrolase protein [Flagelloscypha sp. PMI_526]|nr:Alpha/Beta hydrolase protein [Flagelloscypha sp. PMI_526]
MSFKTTPFTISISQDRLDELKNSLNAARLPPPFYEGTQPHFGMTTDWLRGALHEWKTSYSWKNLEDRLNTFNHFIADVPYDGSTFQVHYIHHKAPQAPNTIPLLMLHGWPGSFLEFLDVIEPLTAANFDVIVASLPGFTFGQGPPVDKDFGRNQVADIMLSLMLGLGYNEFAVQGGDLGSYVARILATQYSQYCKALHLNMFFVKTPKGLDIASLPLDEQEGIKRGEEWEKTEYGYGQMHGTKPSTTSVFDLNQPII